VAGGHKLKNIDISLDWMYQGPSASSNQPSTEEYLLGKIFKTQNKEESHYGPAIGKNKSFKVFTF
jgi:hypothetical protein